MADNKINEGSRVQSLKDVGIPIPTQAKGALNKERAKTAALTMIDDFLRKVGIDDPKELIDAEGMRQFTCGSAKGRAGILEIENELYLCVEAFVMDLPSDKELILPLMHELLTINVNTPGVAKLALGNEVVLSCAMLNLRDLNQPMFYDAIHSTMMLADGLDDDLRKKYGGTSLKRKA